MTGFSRAWLELRAAADCAARNAPLARRFAAALKPRPGEPLRLVDLGAGTGTNARFLAPLIAADQEWLLADHDPALLEAQAAAHFRWAADRGLRASEEEDGAVVVTAAGARWRFRPLRAELASELDRCGLDACDGASMAALADLASAAWIDLLVERLAARHPPFLAALVLDGRRLWQPALAGDALVRGAFARHQHRDKGLGPALGGAAAGYLAGRLRGAGFVVASAPSPWRLGGEPPALLDAVAAGEAAAAAETLPGAQPAIGAWRAAREAARTASLLTIGHRDVLALPPGLR